MIDIEDFTTVRRFSFPNRRYRFRWPIGFNLVYIYSNEKSPYAMCAIPFEESCTYENAQATAKLWVLQLESHGYDLSGHELQLRKQRAIKTAIELKDDGYTGPRCIKCHKKDEGDFLPYPGNMTEQICMVCLVKESK